MKAVWHYRAGAALRERLRSLGLEVAIVGESDRDGFLREIADAEVLLHVLDPVSAAMIAAAPRLRLIQKIGVGVNTIDLDAAKSRGIAVCNMPGTNTPAVAEMTLLLMLATLRRLSELDRLTRAGAGWEPTMDDCGELRGRTVGLVGFGAVARRLAPILDALGARPVYTSRRQAQDATIPYLPFRDLLPAADVLSLHLPLVPETALMIDDAALSAMRRGSVLINTARGGLVDEAALYRALTSEHLRGAGLDVFAEEPVSPDNPLLRLPNVVVTPHLAWLTAQTIERSLDIAVENCRRLSADEPLLNRVV